MTDRPVREGSVPPATPADPSRRGFLGAGGASDSVDAMACAHVTCWPL